MNGRRLLRAKSSSCIVAAEERGPTISRPMPWTCLQCLAPGDEGREHEVAERPVLKQKRPQRLAVDGDIAQGLGDDRGDEHGLPGQEIEFAEKAGRPVADDLVARRVVDRRPRPRGSR